MVDVIILEIYIQSRHECSCSWLFLMFSKRETNRKLSNHTSYPNSTIQTNQKTFGAAPVTFCVSYYVIRTSGNASHVTMSTADVSLTKLDDFFLRLSSREILFFDPWVNRMAPNLNANVTRFVWTRGFAHLAYRSSWNFDASRRVLNLNIIYAHE